MKPLFKKIILVSILAVLIGVSLFFVLSYRFELVNRSKAILTGQGVYDGLELTITLEKTKYALREPVNVTLTLTNISNQSVSFTLGDSWGYAFEVFNVTNSTVYSSSWPPFPDRTSPLVTLPLFGVIPLDAGQNINWTLSWQQDSWSAYILPGTYYIVGQLVSMIYDNRTNSTMKTTRMQITIG